GLDEPRLVALEDDEARRRRGLVVDEVAERAHDRAADLGVALPPEPVLERLAGALGPDLAEGLGGLGRDAPEAVLAESAPERLDGLGGRLLGEGARRPDAR